MREILFRGKIIELCEYQGQWLEGFYAVENGKHFIAIPKENGLNGFYCEPETVGQYTGLTDKNGVKIFEGDIIHGKLGNFAVRWSEYIGAFVAGISTKIMPCLNRGTMKCYEVIGNIYDNLELMGGI